MMILKYGLLFFAGFGTATVVWALLGMRALTHGVRLFTISSFLLAVLGTDIFIIEPHWIQVTKVVVQDEPLARVTKGLRIVQISDIHLTRGIRYRERHLIERINQLNPDIIFITGDFFDSRSQLGPLIELLKSFEHKIGIYAVPGNTDHIVMGTQELKQALAPTGIHLLSNSNEGIPLPNGETLWVVGIDNPYEGHSQLGLSLKGAPYGVPLILLSHEPDVFEDSAREKINMVLAGHTHGGQVNIPFLIKLSEYANRTPYMKGLFQKGDTKMYVNSGIGTKTLPIRFLCRPEITVLEFRS